MVKFCSQHLQCKPMIWQMMFFFYPHRVSSSLFCHIILVPSHSPPHFSHLSSSLLNTHPLIFPIFFFFPKLQLIPKSSPFFFSPQNPLIPSSFPLFLLLFFFPLSPPLPSSSPSPLPLLCDVLFCFKIFVSLFSLLHRSLMFFFSWIFCWFVFFLVVLHLLRLCYQIFFSHFPPHVLLLPNEQ